MDCRVVVKHSSGEEVLRAEPSDTVRAIQMLRLRNNFDFLQERRRASANKRSSDSERVDLGAAGDATSAGHHPINMDSPSSSLDEEDNPIPPEHRPKWCKSKDDKPRQKSSPQEVENVATYPSLLDDPILDTPAIWSSKDRSRLYMYQRNALVQAKNGEETSMMGEGSSQRRPAVETQTCFQGGTTLAAHSSVATSFQRSPSTSIQESSIFSAEANVEASFQTSPALTVQGNAMFSAKTNVAASFQRSPTSSMQGSSVYTAEANIAALFQSSQSSSFQENSLFSANAGSTSLFQSTPESSTQRSGMLSTDERLAEALENTIFFSNHGTSATQINSAHSLEASSSSSFQGSSASSLQASLATSLQGNPMSFNGNSAHSLSNAPFSFYSHILHRSKTTSPPQRAHIFNDLVTVPLYGRTVESSETLSFPQTVTQTYHGHEVIQRNLSQQIQTESEERQSSLKGCISLQEMSTSRPSTSVPLFESFRPMQKSTPENHSFAQNNLNELMSVSPRLDRSQSFQDTTSYQDTQMEQLKPSTSSYAMSVLEAPFNGWQPLNRNLAEPENGIMKFRCVTRDVGGSGEDLVLSPLGEPTKKKRRQQDKLCVSVSTTKLRKELSPDSQSQDNGFLYTPHDFPELPNRSFHGNHGHVDQQNLQCSTAHTSSESAMAMSIFQQHPTSSNSTDSYSGESILNGHNSGPNVAQLNCQSPQFVMPANDQLEYPGNLYCKDLDGEPYETREPKHHERLWDRRMLWLDRTEYMFGPQVRQRLPANVFPMLNDEVFFYMFYQHCRDLSQLESAERLYLKGWRYHMGMKVWLRKVDPIIPNCASFLQHDLSCYIHNNIYEVFNPVLWSIVRHQLDIDENCLEGRPLVPTRRYP